MNSIKPAINNIILSRATYHQEENIGQPFIGCVLSGTLKMSLRAKETKNKSLRFISKTKLPKQRNNVRF